MANLQYVLHKGNKNTGSLKFVQPEAMQAVLEFHSGIAGLCANSACKPA